MKANELMIGDWVYLPSIMSDDKYPVQVLEIQDDCIKYYVGGKKMMVNFKYIEPIPLTPEILEKNDFVQNTKDSIFEHIGCSIIYGKYYRRTEGNALDTGDCLYPIKYVHQLQHALRLCGIEKEIIL